MRRVVTPVGAGLRDEPDRVLAGRGVDVDRDLFARRGPVPEVPQPVAHRERSAPVREPDRERRAPGKRRRRGREAGFAAPAVAPPARTVRGELDRVQPDVPVGEHDPEPVPADRRVGDLDDLGTPGPRRGPDGEGPGRCVVDADTDPGLRAVRRDPEQHRDRIVLRVDRVHREVVAEPLARGRVHHEEPLLLGPDVHVVVSVGTAPVPGGRVVVPDAFAAGVVVLRLDQAGIDGDGNGARDDARGTEDEEEDARAGPVGGVQHGPRSPARPPPRCHRTGGWGDVGEKRF